MRRGCERDNGITGSVRLRVQHVRKLLTKATGFNVPQAVPCLARHFLRPFSKVSSSSPRLTSTNVTPRLETSLFRYSSSKNSCQRSASSSALPETAEGCTYHFFVRDASPPVQGSEVLDLGAGIDLLVLEKLARGFSRALCVVDEQQVESLARAAPNRWVSLITPRRQTRWRTHSAGACVREHNAISDSPSDAMRATMAGTSW